MSKAFTENELDTLLNFIGYGRLDADIWFLGAEESTPDLTNLTGRLKFDQVEDTRHAQETLGLTDSQFEHGNLQNAWRGMSEIMLRLEGRPVSTNSLRSYREKRLGHTDGACLVSSFYPLPAVQGEEFPYAELLPQHATRAAYEKWLKPLRSGLFREMVEQYHPRLIICHGRESWPLFRDVFKSFKPAANGEFELGWDTDTVVILCDNLADESMSWKYVELLGLITENCLAIDTAKPSGPLPLSKAELARQKKEAARQAAAAKRKPTSKHNPNDPYCVCAFCLGYENED